MAEQLEVARIPVGIQGFNGSSNLSQMDVGELFDATNISYDQNLIQKEAGAEKHNASALESGADIIAGHYWVPTTAAEYDVVYVNGKLLRDTAGDGTFSTTLRSGMSTNPVTGQFIDGGKESASDNKKLFFVNGEDSVEYVDGTGATTTALTNAAADWTGTNQPITGDIHEDRLWLAGNLNDPHRVYYSLVSDHADFVTADAGSISVYPGEGCRINRIVSFKGFLIVFKECGVYYIDTRDALIGNWKVGRVSRNIGTLSPASVDIVDDDIWFIDQIGLIRTVSTLNEFGSIATNNIFDMHEMTHWVQSKVTYANLNKARLMYYPARREVHAAYPVETSTTNNTRVVVDLSDLQTGHGIRFRLIDRDDVYSMWLRTVSSVPGYGFGDGSGFVYKGDQSARTKDGPYSARFATAPTDFADQNPSLGTINKHGHYLELVIEQGSGGTLSVDIFWDNTLYDSVNFDIDDAGATLGTFVIGTDVLSNTGSLKNIRRRITGQGRVFSMIGRHSSDSQNFKLAEAYIGIKMADHRIQRGE